MTSHVSPADDLLDRAVTAVRDRGAPDRPPAALLDRTVAAVDAAARAPRPWLATRLGRPLAAIAAAAALATAAAVMIAIVPPTGGGSAFAAMLDKVREVKSVRCKTTFLYPDGREPDVKYSGITTETAAGTRLEMGPLVTIFGRDGTTMILNTATKTASTLSHEEGGAPRAPRPDLLAKFREVDGGPGEPIEGRQVGAVAAVGYRVKSRLDSESPAMRVYVDPATSLPVLVEQDFHLPEGGVMQRMVHVYSDFEWDVEVDPSLVSLDPPAGYRREQVDVGVLRTAAPAGGPQEAIASGLQFYADRMDGALPVGLDDFAPMAALMQTIDPEQRKKLPAMAMQAQLEFIKQQLGPWFGLAEALGGLEKQKIQIHYLGKGLKAGNGSTLVAWWKAEQPGRAIAIYDDFSWKEIDEPAAE
jgi:hypothetical protein